MSYQYNLLLKRTSGSEWSILSEKGATLHVLNRCVERHEAESRARAWASSWVNVSIKVVDEQEGNRDKVPSKT